MKTCLGLNHGQFGDLLIQLPILSSILKNFPDCQITYNINKKYAGIVPLLLNHPHIKNIYISDGYEKFSEKDEKFLSEKKFDHVFNPMPKHDDPEWYNKFTYCQEIARIHRLPPPESNQINLTKWFDVPEKNDKLITTSLFASGTQYEKTLEFKKIRELFWEIESLGYEVVRLDQNEEFDRLCYSEWESNKNSMIDAARLMLSARLHITVDTSWSWISSGYQHPTLLLLGCNYPGMTDPFSHVPENPNQQVLWSQNIKNIPVEKIIDTIRAF